MSKQSKIRWRKSDTELIERTVKNFNAKLYRIQKKHPEMIEFLPSKISKKEVINSIETRADFNRVVNSFQRFSKRGSENPVKSSRGAKSTQWEVEEFKHKQRIENARRTRERKKLEQQEVKSRGQGTGVKRAEMGSIKENSLKPSKKNFKNLSQKEWELAKRNIDNQLNASYRDEQKLKMKENYIKGLIEGGFSQEIIDVVEKTDIDKFVQTVTNDTEASFDFIYDPIEHKLKAEVLKETWEKANKDS